MSGKNKKLLIAEHSLLFCYSFTSKLISSKNIRYLWKMINLLNIYCSSDEKYWWIRVLGISKKIKRDWQKRDLWHCMSKRVKSIFQSEDPCSLPSIICKLRTSITSGKTSIPSRKSEFRSKMNIQTTWMCKLK